MEASRSDAAVGIALAEFNALRSEIDSHIAAQTTVVGLGITALGIIVGFVAKEGADSHLLLIVPPLSMFVILLFTAESYRMTMLGNHIRQDLWPFLEHQVGKLPSWEVKISEYESSKGVLAKAAFIDSPAIILFLVASIAALKWVQDSNDALWWAGCAMTGVAVLVPSIVAYRSRPSTRALRRSRRRSNSAD